MTVYLFGEFSLQCDKFELTRRGRRLKLERKPLELLILLVTKHGQVVTRAEIANLLWKQEVFVDTEHGINTAVRKIRQVLGDTADLPRFLQTISGSGYRFIASVTEVLPQVHESSPAAKIEDPAAPPNGTAAPEVLAPGKLSVAPAGDTTGERRRRRWLIAVACASAVIAIAAAFSGGHSLAARVLHRNSVAAINAVAVLPLQNLSGDPGQQYFADGMTDELITELARIPHFRVASRTSVMAYKGSPRTLPDLARELGVDAIVEGSILRAGDRVRITAQLIDARTDRHLWAQSFEGSAADILALQDSVARQIANQASFAVSPPPPRAPVNPAAYDAYLRGRYFFNKQDFPRSLEYFKQAVDLDSGYASAHAGYASALEAVTTFNIGSPDELMPRVLSEAERAIQLEPQNGEAYTDIGSVQTIYGWNWTAAEQSLARGVALNPSDSIAEFKYAVYFDAIRRPDEAVTHMRRALQLDPLSFLISLRMGVALYYDRQYDAAIAQLQRAGEMEQHSRSVEFYLSLVYEQKGDHDEAVQHHLAEEHDGQPKSGTVKLLSLYRKRGWEAFWRASRGAVNASAIPCEVYEAGIDDLRVGELGDAFSSFQHAIERHCFRMTFIQVDPLFDPVRQDSRYIALLKRLNQ